MKEGSLQAHVRLAAANAGLLLWRNNSGAMTDKNGRLVRFGLGNDSAALNKYIKSSDLIGITPVMAYVEGRGWCRLGVFTALEIKSPGWYKTPGDERAEAQQKYIDIVRDAGGFAGFVTDVQDICKITGVK